MTYLERLMRPAHLNIIHKLTFYGNFINRNKTQKQRNENCFQSVDAPRKQDEERLRYKALLILIFDS